MGHAIMSWFLLEAVQVCNFALTKAEVCELWFSCLALKLTRILSKSYLKPNISHTCLSLPTSVLFVYIGNMIIILFILFVCVYGTWPIS